jgi:hypothetical protein
MKTQLSTAMLNGLQYYAQQDGAEKPRPQTTRALVARGLLHEALGLTAEGYAALGYQLTNDSTDNAENLDSGSQEIPEMTEAHEVAMEVSEVIEAAPVVSEAAPEVSESAPEVSEAAPEVSEVSEAQTCGDCGEFDLCASDAVLGRVDTDEACDGFSIKLKLAIEGILRGGYETSPQKYEGTVAGLGRTRNEPGKRGGFIRPRNGQAHDATRGQSRINPLARRIYSRRAQRERAQNRAYHERDTGAAGVTSGGLSIFACLDTQKIAAHIAASNAASSLSGVAYV